MIVREDGQHFVGFNTCDVGHTCPRSDQGAKSGEDYHLCQSVHAEIQAVELAKDSAEIPGEAYLYGHTYICKDCQEALLAINVKTFHIVTSQPPCANFAGGKS